MRVSVSRISLCQPSAKPEANQSTGAIYQMEKASQNDVKTNPIKIELIEDTDAQDTAIDIGLKLIIPSLFETQARRRARFTPEGLESLGASIVEHGLIYPIIVRPRTDQGTPYEIAVGERRWRASVLKGLQTIKCFVRRLTDAQVVELQYQENHDREEPNALDDAFTFKFLMDKEGYTLEKLAKRFSRELRDVRKILKLNDLITEAVAEVADGKLPLRHAYYLSRFPASTQKIIVEEKYAYKFGDFGEGAVSYQEFKDEIDEHILRRLDAAPFDKSDPRLHIKQLLCGDCRERSSVETHLFPELDRDDRCLNKTCFELKTNVHLNLQREAIAAQKAVEENKPVEEIIKSVPLVTEKSFHNSPFGREKVQTNQILLDEPECGFSELSLAVGGGKKGQQVYVCKNDACDVHHPKPAVKNLSQENLQKLEDEFDQRVSDRMRERIVIDAAQTLDDYKPLWMYDDLIQRLIVEFWWLLPAENKEFISKAIESWKDAPRARPYKWDITAFVKTLDKRQQSQILFLLLHSGEDPTWFVDGDFWLEKIAKDYLKADYKRLDAEIRLELAPEEFKIAANLYLQQVKNGQPAETPRFWLKEPDEPDESPEMETQNLETVA